MNLKQSVRVTYILSQHYLYITFFLGAFLYVRFMKTIDFIFGHVFVLTKIISSCVYCVSCAYQFMSVHIDLFKIINT